ncbi:MAG: TonB-dependent receptor plug domain-containing protein [Caulobacterales bacterium]
MAEQNRRERLLSTSFLLGAALTTGFAFAAPAVAQESGDDVIVVTGSRIPQPNLETTSPVTSITAEDITTQGVTRVEDLVNQLPQAFAAQASTVSNGSTGTATVDLRGLGSERTLVLIDGRRMPYGSPFEASADLNQIPGQLIERVEVLTGGASAVYGSDALSGVVNFIMMDDFEGVRLDAQYSFFQHNNDYDTNGDLRSVIASRSATNPSQFKLPDDNVIHGYGREITGIMGVGTDDGAGNITAYLSYRNNSEITQANYDYSACSIGGTAGNIATLVAGGNFVCGGSGTTGPGGQFTDFVNFALTLNPADGGQTFIPYSTSRDAFNFGPYNYFQRPDERYSLGAFGRYTFNEHAELYTQLMFTDYRTVAQIAPSGNFFSTSTLNCGNPLLSASQAASIGCSSADIAADTSETVYIGRRNIEGGGRQDDLQYQSYRTVVGIGGNIFEGWDYDINATFSRVQLSRVYKNDFSTTRLGRALDVVNVGGVPTCRSVVNGTDPNCVPYNIFRLGGVTQGALNYVQTPGIQRATMQQQVVVGTIFGDLGVAFPLAESNISMAFGLEYRRDLLDNTVDTAFSTGDLAGQGGATTGLNGKTDNLDAFFEAQIPLIENRPGFDRLAIDVAYRYSDYNTGISTDTYKVGAEWAPIEDVRLRGSFQRAVRAPNVIDLFSAQSFGLFDLDEDPCGPARTATLAECTATGVPASFYGSAALDSPAGQYNQLSGGNPNLTPEEGDTRTIGLVFTPRFAPGLVLSIDYFDIEITNLISTTGSENIIAACYDFNDASQCARIRRNANGQLWVGSARVENLNTNIGGLQTTGVDIVADYSFDPGFFPGTLGINYVATLLESNETDTGLRGFPVVECAGVYGGSTCGVPKSEYRHRARLNWDTPWNVSLSGTWRHYGEVTLNTASGRRVDNTFEAENYFDLAGSWQVRDNAGLRFGVNNVLDDDPPLSASVGTTGNGNTYPQIYDSLGRYFFAGVTLDF